MAMMDFDFDSALDNMMSNDVEFDFAAFGIGDDDCDCTQSE